MDAVEFLKTLRRMCHCECLKCEFGKRSGSVSCNVWQKTNPEEAVAVLEEWAKEHPEKSRQSEFLKHYPDARILRGRLNVCPMDVFGDTKINCNNHTCNECKNDFWLAEVEE